MKPVCSCAESEWTAPASMRMKAPGRIGTFFPSRMKVPSPSTM